jgi:hypothetical protein
MTVALGLLAFKIAGGRAGAVLGTALAIKMIAYVGIAPIAGGLAGYLPRRPFLFCDGPGARIGRRRAALCH